MKNTGYVFTASIDSDEDIGTTLEIEQTDQDGSTVFITLFNGNEKTSGAFEVSTLRTVLSKFYSEVDF